MAKRECSKEHEWQSMAERIKAVEVKQELTNDKLDKIDTKLDTFINRADDKYATKEEVKAVSKHFTEINSRQDKTIESNTQKIIKIIEKVSVISGSVALITKLLGLW